jgi:4'-phosphopantetheinyl transferase
MSLDVGPAAARAAATLLSDDERRRASGFARIRDRRRFTVARAELRRRLGMRLGVPPRGVAFAYGPHGKPYLAERRAHAHLRFNVSHTDGVVALAFANGRDVGVDIEVLRAVPDAGAVAARLCSPAEWRAWASLAEHQKRRGFLNWWTRKEAFVKARGSGLCHPFDAFDVSLAPGEPARLLRVAGETAHGAGWTLRALDCGPRLVGAVAFATAGRDASPDTLVEVQADVAHA